MKKSLISNTKNHKKQRGVAVIFTLGILGLLTVIALGFASTALLNNSLSKNVMNDAYARGLAKNLALTQVMYVINHGISPDDFFDYRNVYTWGTDANSANNKDFLWKLDYSDAGVQLFKYEPDKSANNPANNVRWQYVTDTTSPTAKIIGRYAYIVVPDKGRIDPSVNLGKDDDIDSTSIKKQENRIPLGVSAGSLADAYDKFRWMTYREIIKKASISEAFYAFEFDGISPSLTMKSPEAFWKDGKLYSRFNMNRSDWDTITPENLCGVGKTLAEFPAEQEFIPWLKDMYDYTGSDLKKQALQIAANIIQYNLPGTAETIADGPADWLSSTSESHPTYAGIGRHPMLNEIGFLVRVKTDVTAEFVSQDTEAGTITYKYTPIYYITVDAGAELIYPFGPAPTGGMPDSEIRFSGTEYKEGSITVNNMILRFRLRKFLQDGSTELTDTVTDLGDNLIDSDGVLNPKMIHNHHDIMVIGSDGAVTKYNPESSTTPVQMDDSGLGLKWSNFTLSLKSADWNSSPMYTKADKFWKGQQTSFEQTLKIPIRSFTMTTKTSVGEASKIATAIARRMTIEWQAFTPGNAVLKVAPKGSDAYLQRDVVLSLKEQTLPSNSSGQDYEGHDIAGWSGMDKDTEKVWFVAYEVKDPLVNQNQTDWKDTSTGLLAWSEATSLTNDYPGTCIKESESSEKHVNNPFKEILAAGASDPVKILLTSFGYSSSDSDPAYVDGVSRLPTSFIRHGQMLSFWELGCISRGKLFENLNLQNKDNSSAPTYVRDRGDAVLFDQLKFTDENYTAGKINLNTEVHKVWEQLFRSVGTAEKKLTFKKDIHKSSGDDLLSAGTDSASSVKFYQSNLSRYKLGKLHSSDEEPESECLACQMVKIITKPYQFQNRADLLSSRSDLPAVTGCTKPTDTEWNAMQDLLLSGDTYLEQIQLVSKLMPLLRTAPVDTLRVVILAQSIRDMGGNIPVLVDWDGTGIETAVPASENAYKKKAMFKAGYRRSPSGSAIAPSASWTEPALSKTITTNTVGTYDLGADKITGESRLVATLVRDPVKKTWKLVRVQYVE